jgi:hypothetical protein
MNAAEGNFLGLKSCKLSGAGTGDAPGSRGCVSASNGTYRLIRVVRLFMLFVAILGNYDVPAGTSFSSFKVSPKACAAKRRCGSDEDVWCDADRQQLPGQEGAGCAAAPTGSAGTMADRL